jgi:hypothetical protein
MLFRERHGTWSHGTHHKRKKSLPLRHATKSVQEKLSEWVSWHSCQLRSKQGPGAIPRPESSSVSCATVVHCDCALFAAGSFGVFKHVPWYPASWESLALATTSNQNANLSGPDSPTGRYILDGRSRGTDASAESVLCAQPRWCMSRRNPRGPTATQLFLDDGGRHSAPRLCSGR